MSEANTAVLSEYDFIVVIDKSGSMADPVKAGSSVTRWEAVQESAMTLVRDVEKFDSDGLGLVLFSGSGIVSLDGVASNSPRGSTPLAEALTAALKLAGKSDKKDFIVVFTDGVPDDKDAAAKVIINQANSQETDDACTILFIQVGDDAGAGAYLKKLDDDLSGAKFDIVDAKTMAEADQFATTAELIVHAIND
jgi:Mg-chelatase subunit ChlD